MTAAERLRSQTGRIIARYQMLLETSASPLIATAERWLQCRWQAESIIFECADRVNGCQPSMSAAFQRTAELGARRAAESIPGKESVRAALLLWQAAAPIFRDALVAGPEQQDASDILPAALDALAQALLMRLLHGAVGYYGADILSQVTPGDSGARQFRHADADAAAVLTIRERQVLACVAKAMTNHEIGRQLGIAETTVKRHLRNVFEKLGTASRMEAIQKVGLSVELPSV